MLKRTLSGSIRTSTAKLCGPSWPDITALSNKPDSGIPQFLTWEGLDRQFDPNEGYADSLPSLSGDQPMELPGAPSQPDRSVWNPPSPAAGHSPVQPLDLLITQPQPTEHALRISQQPMSQWLTHRVFYPGLMRPGHVHVVTETSRSRTPAPQPKRLIVM
eukprot:15541815-Heterocapsa_arctica.AAC.1